MRRASLLVGIGFVLITLFSVAVARAGCTPEPASQWAPAGVAGCELGGPTDGIASTWGGSSAAANWCVYPFTDCTPIRVESLVTGRSIEVTPAMYCHCYWLTDRRLVDLTTDQVLALGLDPAAGLFAVRVTPLRDALPDTAMR